MGWTESDITVNGERLHVSRRGQGTPLVLAHGMSDNGHCWTRVAERLEGEFDIIAYDARSHGLSTDAPYPAGGAAGDLIALVEALGLDRPLAMGHSMGAATVSEAIARRPDRFRAGVLEDPPWGLVVAPPPDLDSPEFAAFVEAYTNWQASQKTVRTVDDIIADGKAASPRWHDDEFPAWGESKLQFRVSLDPAHGSPLADMEPWESVAARISLPVLLVCGQPEQGAIVTPEVAAAASELCPTMETVTLVAGHNIRREAYEPFLSAITAFLRSHRG
jgi:pimeloyl-ACP methyl ester carboxylesterase